MTAQQSLSYYPLSGSHQAEPKLRWMVILSAAIHLIALAILMGLPSSSSKNIFYSPVYSVDLVGPPPAGTLQGGGSPRTGGAETGSTAEVKKQSVRLWKGPSQMESQVKALAERSHPLLTIPAKEKTEGSRKKAEPEEARRAAEGSATETAGTPEKTGVSPASPTQTGAAQGPGAGSGGPPAQTGAAQGPGAGSGGPWGVPGGAGGGMGSNLRFSRYYQAVYEKIYQSWILPEYVTEKQGAREAIVVIKIQRDGKILGAEFEKMSGNRQLDSSVMNAIRKADPLPPLPEDFRENVLELGIRFTPPQPQ
ncbi:MAG: cell envelope integrity protein TolA [Proteobacteria bacterium]|nr:cell envelope integrity protein TolA [Pseudomonadota bacterium]